MALDECSLLLSIIDMSLMSKVGQVWGILCGNNFECDLVADRKPVKLEKTKSWE